MDLITTPIAATYTPPETAIVHAAEASLTQRGVPSVVHIVQYDRTMPILAVRLSADGAPYAVPAGAAVNFRAKKPDGTHVYNPALGLSADRGTVYVSVTAQTAAAAGTLAAVIEIVLSGAVAATAHFAAEIDPNPVPQDAVESTDEYKTIYELLQETQEAAAAAAQSMANAVKSASDAADSAENAAQSQTAAAASAVSAEQSKADALESAEEAAQSKADAATSAGEAAQSEAAAAQSKTDAAASAADAAHYAELAQQVSQGAVGYYETSDALKAAHPAAQAGNWAIVGATDTIWVWDTETDAWLDTGQNMDLSDYYTKQQTDAALAGKLDTAGGTVTGTLVLSRVADASGVLDNRPALMVGGNPDGMHIEIDNNEIIAKANATTGTNLYLNNDGGGAVYVGAGGLIVGNQNVLTGLANANAAAASAQSTANSASTAAANANTNANNRMPIAGGTFTGYVYARNANRSAIDIRNCGVWYAGGNNFAPTNDLRFIRK